MNPWQSDRLLFLDYDAPLPPARNRREPAGNTAGAVLFLLVVAAAVGTGLVAVVAWHASRML